MNANQKIDYSNLPLIYSCSGCSSAAQMANRIAVDLDREGTAEMSCIAGVGGDVRPLVGTAASGRIIAVIDGCPLNCAKQCLSRHGISPDLHVELTRLGVKKQTHVDFNRTEANMIKAVIREKILVLTMIPAT
jgi:uncharacterized metal-binding protein